MKQTKRALAVSAATAFVLLIASSSVLIGQAAPAGTKRIAPTAPAAGQAEQDSHYILTLNGRPVEAGAGPAAGSPARVVLEAGPAPKVETSSTKGHDLASRALGYRGVPYRWAGMSTRGMDCSGLVSKVLLETGVKAPHNAAALSRLGRPIHYQDLQTGDLLFFNTRGRGISHVAIFLGNDRFVHASSVNGQVMVSSLKERYYGKRLVCARRLTR